jgi:tetratricopeptide (TPR) repeat protein
MMATRSRWIRGAVLALSTSAAVPAFSQVPLPPPQQPTQAPAGTLELLLDQGRRLFDAFQYDQALPLFDRLVLALGQGGQTPRADLLIQTLELRARSRFALGDVQGAEQDFSALLATEPSHKLGAGVSPRVVNAFEAVRKLVVGQAVLSLTPAGEIKIDGRTVALGPDPTPMDLAAGEHHVSATRQGHRPIDQRFAVTAGTSTRVELTLERVSATLTLSSNPEDVEVWLDGTSRGTTARGASGAASAPFVIEDLPPGTHRLQLKRNCFQDLERTINIAQPEDVRVDTLTLMPAVASVTVVSSEPGAAVYVDGAARGAAPTEIAGLCAGAHVIEVRGARGRFVDRREWKTGDTATLNATLRPAFAILSAPGTAGDVRQEVERALGAAKGLLVFVPADADAERALAGENVPVNWLDPPSVNSARPSRDVVREISKRLSTKLGTQGVAGISVSPDRSQITVTMLAAGSGDPDVVTYAPADSASRARAVEQLSAPLPPVLRASIGSSVIDVDGVSGAVVVRAGGLGAKAGLAVGDVIVGAGGSPISSARELETRLAALPTGVVDLSLDVRSSDGATKTISGAVSLVADTLPLREATLPYNRAVSDLQESVRSLPGALDKAAARVNLAIAHLRLGNYAEAEAALRAAELPDGPGVSAGTVAYLLGLCLEAMGRTADARAVFTKASEATEARLSHNGPLIAPLARQKIR